MTSSPILRRRYSSKSMTRQFPDAPYSMFRCRTLMVLEIQHVLTAAGGSHRPVVFVTGKGDIPTSVRAMKAGAIDFLTKPVKEQDLFEALSRAEARDAESRRLRSELDVMQAKVRDPDPTRTRSAYACRGGAAQQADCRRSGYGRKDHQGSPQPDDGETWHSNCRRPGADGREAQTFEIGKTHLLAQGPTRRRQGAAAIVVHGGSFPMDCCCGRRSGRAQGLEPVAAFARVSCPDLRIGTGISRGVASRSSRLPDCRSPDAGNERSGASTASCTQRHKNSDNPDHCAC